MALCYVTVWLYFMSQYGSILCNIVAPSDISVSLSMLRHNMALCYVLTWLFVTSQYGSMIRNSITPTAAVAAACVPRCSRGRDGHEGGGGGGRAAVRLWVRWLLVIIKLSNSVRVSCSGYMDHQFTSPPRV